MVVRRVIGTSVLLLGFVGSLGAETVAGPACVYPDLSSVSPVTLEAGPSQPDGTGGEIPGGRWELIAVQYEAPTTITGTAVGALELDASDPASGFGSLALDIDISSPTVIAQEERGAGPYTASGIELSFTNDCPGELTLGNSEYSIDDSGAAPVLTLWGSESFVLPGPIPIPITIFLQAEFVLVEPQGGDPIFEDRFEAIP